MSADCAYSERNGRHPRPARFVRFLALTFVAAFSISKIYPSKCGCSLKAYQDSTQPRSVLATLDGLHVATALLLKPEAFFSFDERQRKLARAAGLRVLPA